MRKTHFSRHSCSCNLPTCLITPFPVTKHCKTVIHIILQRSGMTNSFLFSCLDVTKLLRAVGQSDQNKPQIPYNPKQASIVGFLVISPPVTLCTTQFLLSLLSFLSTFKRIQTDQSLRLLHSPAKSKSNTAFIVLAPSIHQISKI